MHDSRVSHFHTVLQSSMGPLTEEQPRAGFFNILDTTSEIEHTALNNLKRV